MTCTFFGFDEKLNRMPFPCQDNCHKCTSVRVVRLAHDYFLSWVGMMENLWSGQWPSRATNLRNEYLDSCDATYEYLVDTDDVLPLRSIQSISTLYRYMSHRGPHGMSFIFLLAVIF